MKNTTIRPLTALLLFALISPTFVPAQDTQAPARQTPAPANERRPVRNPPAAPSALIEGNAVGTRANNTRDAIQGDIGEAISVIQDKYVDGDDLDKPEKPDARLKYDNLVKSSVIGMLRSLDPHSNYYDPKEFEELTTEQRSEYYGVGASIINRRRGEQIDTYVTATFPEAPAYKAGLRFGDRIVAVDDVSMRNKSSAEVRDKIRGPRNSKVKVTVERATNDKPETIEITRDRVDQPSVPDAYMLRPGVGYIDMTKGFNTTTSGELQNAIDFLRQREMTQLVLDLRDNPGGFLEQSVRVAEKFLPAGQRILTQRGREGERSYNSRNSAPDQTPLVVLVNRASASASEIVAGALQDHDRALIVGETSFGKGLVQSIIRLDSGAGVAGLTLTSAKYYTPSGRLIQRDYSSGSTYDYYTRGGSLTRAPNGAAAAAQQQPARPAGPESRTDSGRVVYGGGGISPDEGVAPREFEPSQIKFIDPIFFFARDIINNRVAGFPTYNNQKPIDFEHSLRPTDFQITDEVFAAFKKFVAADPAFKLTPAQIDRQSTFIRRQLRYDIVTAAYGTVAAQRVLIADDPQVARGVEVLPRARELAVNAQRARASRRSTFQQ